MHHSEVNYERAHVQSLFVYMLFASHEEISSKSYLTKREKKKISKEHCVIAAKSEPVPTRETDLRLKMIEVKERGQERWRRGEGEMRSRQTKKKTPWEDEDFEKQQIMGQG